MFGDEFLAKRYQSGYIEGYKEGYKEGFKIGWDKGRGGRDAELLKFLEEHPELTRDQVKDLLRSGAVPPNGKAPVKGR